MHGWEVIIHTRTTIFQYFMSITELQWQHKDMHQCQPLWYPQHMYCIRYWINTFVSKISLVDARKLWYSANLLLRSVKFNKTLLWTQKAKGMSLVAFPPYLFILFLVGNSSYFDVIFLTTKSIYRGTIIIVNRFTLK